MPTAFPVRARSNQGPYYVAGEKVRREIREGHPGRVLSLHLRVLSAATRKPTIKGAAVDGTRGAHRFRGMNSAHSRRTSVTTAAAGLVSAVAGVQDRRGARSEAA
jgi:hypothetical protein